MSHGCIYSKQTKDFTVFSLILDTEKFNVKVIWRRGLERLFLREDCIKGKKMYCHCCWILIYLNLLYSLSMWQNVIIVKENCLENDSVGFVCRRNKDKGQRKRRPVKERPSSWLCLNQKKKKYFKVLCALKSCPRVKMCATSHTNTWWIFPS